MEGRRYRFPTSPRKRSANPTIEDTRTSSVTIRSSARSGWITPTIIEDEEEDFFQSMERIRLESLREEREALKLLCNDPNANRIAARAGETKKWCQNPLRGRRQSTLSNVPYGFISSRMLQTTLTGDSRGDFQLVNTATEWERIELKEKSSDIARRAPSLKSLMVETPAPRRSNTGNSSSSSNTSCSSGGGSCSSLSSRSSHPHSWAKQRNNSSPESVRIACGIEEDWLIDVDTINHLSNTSTRGGGLNPNRPPSPQPIDRANWPPRRDSLDNSDVDDHAYPSSCPAGLPPWGSLPRVERMGAIRLQRCFESILPQEAVERRLDPNARTSSAK